MLFSAVVRLSGVVLIIWSLTAITLFSFEQGGLHWRVFAASITLLGLVWWLIDGFIEQDKYYGIVIVAAGFACILISETVAFAHNMKFTLHWPFLFLWLMLYITKEYYRTRR